MTRRVERHAPVTAPLGVWLVASLLWHGGLLFVGGHAIRGSLLPEVGEDAELTTGAGEVEVAFIVPGRADGTTPPQEPASSTPTAPADEGPTSVAAPSAPSRASWRSPVREPAPGPPAEALEPTPVATAATPSTSVSTPAGPSADAAAARAAILEASGHLGGTTARAGALLGERPTCEDPIAGTWVAYRYSMPHQDWARFTLTIERDGSELRGTIVARMWRGLPSDRNPPACSPGGWDYTVRMEATGNVQGDQMSFAAHAHRVVEVGCASTAFGYNPDHFTGRVDGLADRMHTVNNDGGRDLNAPYVFRRTRC